MRAQKAAETNLSGRGSKSMCPASYTCDRSARSLALHTHWSVKSIAPLFKYYSAYAYTAARAVTVCMNANGVFIFDTKLGGQLMAACGAPSLGA